MEHTNSDIENMLMDARDERQFILRRARELVQKWTHAGIDESLVDELLDLAWDADYEFSGYGTFDENSEASDEEGLEAIDNIIDIMEEDIDRLTRILGMK